MLSIPEMLTTSIPAGKIIVTGDFGSPGNMLLALKILSFNL